MATNNIPEIIKCVKILLMKKDPTTSDEQAEDNDEEDICNEESNDVKCGCHCSRNRSLNNVVRKNLNSFFSSIQDSKIKETIETQGSSLLLTDCLCFGCRGSLFQMNGCKGDVIWEYVVICLKTLLSLNQSLRDDGNQGSTTKKQNNETHQPNLVGVQDQDIICNLIELVMSLGVIPNLLPGIGRPVKPTSDFQVVLPKSNIHPRKILTVINVLLALMKDKILHTLILSKNGNDIIASLIQLRYCPSKVLDINVELNCCCVKENVFKGCLNCSNLCKHEKRWCENELDYILDRTYQPLIIKELLILQRCSIVNKKANNKWFLRIIGFKLSKCMMQDNGVKYVIEGILAGCGTDRYSV